VEFFTSIPFINNYKVLVECKILLLSIIEAPQERKEPHIKSLMLEIMEEVREVLEVEAFLQLPKKFNGFNS